MELRHLRYFIGVADAESFTKAAERLAVSQPSLSVQVANLEEELGVPLFDRLGRRVLLTEAGRLFRPYAERILRESELATQAVREWRGGAHGRLTVGTLSTVNTYLIPPLVCRLTQQFHGLQLHIQAGPSSLIEEGLLENRLDVGLCLLPLASSKLIAHPLFTETLVLVAPDQTSLPRRLRMRELAELPLVLLPSDYCLRKMIEVECHAVGVQPTVAVEMTAPEGILEAVKQGAGMTILPELYVRKSRPSGLKVVPLYDPVPRHDVGMAVLAHRHLSRPAEGLMQLCRTVVRDLQRAMAPHAEPLPHRRSRS